MLRLQHRRQSSCTSTKSPARKVKTSYFGPACHLSAVAKEIKLRKQKLEPKEESRQGKQKRKKVLVFHTQTVKLSL